MMIVGFAVTAPLAGHFLDPFSGPRLVAVSGTVSLVAFGVAALALAGVERRLPVRAPEPAEARRPFFTVLARVLADPVARTFTVFVFVSMLAYSAQELILEPYAGLVFAMTPGATTKLRRPPARRRARRHAAGGGGDAPRPGHRPRVPAALDRDRLRRLGRRPVRPGERRGGGIGLPLRTTVFALGVANGAYAVAAIGSMMALAGRGDARERGTRMGVWGAAQGVAFGAGGFLGAVAVDAVRLVTAEPVQAYAAVFAAEGLLFLVAVVLAARLDFSPGTGPGAARSCLQREVRPWPGWTTAAPAATATTSWWSAAGRPAPRRRPTSPGPATRCCSSTSPGGSSPAAARSRRG